MITTLIHLFIFLSFLIHPCFSHSHSPDQEQPQYHALMQLAYGHILARSIHVAAELNIADQLIDQMMDHATLAKHLKISEQNLFRLMRVLISHGIFAQDQQGRYQLNDYAQFLRSDHPSGLHAKLAKEMDEKYWGALGHLLYTIKTGKSAFRHQYELDFQSYVQKDKKAAQRFDTHTDLNHENSKIAEHFNFNAYPVIVDIGGRSEALGRQVLQLHHHPQWLLLSQTATGPTTSKPEPHPEERLQVKAGSFFEAIPGGDLYVLKMILHNWPDETCIQILKNVSKAMNLNSHILIIEPLIPSGSQPSLEKDLDIQKMAIGDSMMRTLEQLQAIIEKSCLTIVQIKPVAETKLYIIECKKRPLAPSQPQTEPSPAT